MTRIARMVIRKLSMIGDTGIMGSILVHVLVYTNLCRNAPTAEGRPTQKLAAKKVLSSGCNMGDGIRATGYAIRETEEPITIPKLDSWISHHVSRLPQLSRCINPCVSVSIRGSLFACGQDRLTASARREF